MASAPLLMSNDLKNVPAASKALLQNKAVLEINQDPMVRMPFRWRVDGAPNGTHFWYVLEYVRTILLYKKIRYYYLCV